MKKKNSIFVALGRKGGSAGTGKSKARSSAQARAAVRKRWAKSRKVMKVADKFKWPGFPGSSVAKGKP